MKLAKLSYIVPLTETVVVNAAGDIAADDDIKVSQTTTPDDSDAKDFGFDEDEDFSSSSHNLWDD